MLHWKRRAVGAENAVLVSKIYDTPVMRWLLDHLHMLEVDTDMAYCEEQKRPALSFRSLTVHDYRPWSVKSESQTRLREALKKAMRESLNDQAQAGGV